MGLLDGLFGKKNSAVAPKRKTLPWIPLVELAQLEEIVERSEDKPQLIFKHSVSCGISRMILQMFSGDYPLATDDADLYFLDLHAYRELSNEVARKFQVFHESPQLLIIKNGKVVEHQSHGAITEIPLEEYV